MKKDEREWKGKMLTIGFRFFLQMGLTLILATLDGLDVGLLGDVIVQTSGSGNTFLLAVAFFFRQWEVPSGSGNFLTNSGNAFFFIISSIAVQTPGSGISNLLAVGTSFTGSGNLYCQWELSPGSGNALCILFPTHPTFR
nr:hypothetical protein [Tanacetum cinerariifolium]